MIEQTEALDAQADAIINASRAPNRSIGDTMQLAVVTALAQSATRIAELEAERDKSYLIDVHVFDHEHAKYPLHLKNPTYWAAYPYDKAPIGHRYNPSTDGKSERFEYVGYWRGFEVALPGTLSELSALRAAAQWIKERDDV